MMHTEKFLEIVLAENPVHKNFIDRALAHLTDDEKSRLEDYLDYAIGKGLSPDYLAQSYLTIVEDTFREQLYFMKHKEYRHKSYADVAGDVYHNDDYMNRYMYGLAVTAFLWPNHVDLARFFNQTLPTDKQGTYLEIGPGHGYYMMTAMTKSAFDNFTGVDISAASIAQTQNILGHFAAGKNYSLKQCDFLEADDLQENSCDAIVMGEVLEHVENPDVFLQRIRSLAKDDAYIYVTTCINAPAIDHIYLWRDCESLEDMIEGCGLKIKEADRLPYEGKTLKEAQAEALAINVGYVLEKA